MAAKRLMVWVMLLAVVTAVSAPLHAQQQDEDEGDADANPQCEAVLNAAAASLLAECAEQPIDSACHGNAPTQITFNDDADLAMFDNPGDIVLLAEIESLATGATEITEGQWGVVRMTPRRNFSDAVVTLVALGDVTLTNAGSPDALVPSVVVQVMAEQGANVRAAPDANAEQIDILYMTDAVRATGTAAEGSWVRIEMPGGAQGWVTATAFTLAALADLADVDPDSPPGYGAMQAFTLATNDSDRAACPAIPPDGVLIQSPAGDTTARLMVNDVPVWMAPESTVFLSAGAGDKLRAAVLEGSVDMSTLAPLVVNAGEETVFRAGEAPIPRIYDYNALTRLPTHILPRPVFVALDFSTVVRPAYATPPLSSVAENAPCTIVATVGAVNLREAPDPSARVRHVMQMSESATPDGRAQGTDGVLWWRLAENVWVNSFAVGVGGACGDLPILPPR